MKEVSVIALMPVQIPGPVAEDSMDELRDTLVPAQEDDLPQGVLELMATLILRHRPAMDAGRTVAWQSMGAAQETSQVEHRPASVAKPAPQSGPLLSKPAPSSLLHPMVSVAPKINQVTAPTPLNRHISIELEPALIERSTSMADSLQLDTTTRYNAPSSPTVDGPLPEFMSSLPTPRHVCEVARPPVLSPVPLQPLKPLPALDAVLESVPGRGLLQVPFNKASASGQVTISRVPDEPIRNLQISPSNALVFEQLKAPFELAREPAWRLTDSGGEQQRQGSHQAPDDEQAEHSEHPA